MPIKNYLNVRPIDLAPGDVLVATVTCHIFYGPGGKLAYRLYRCPYPNPQLSEDGVPQGNRISPSREVVEHLFPVVIWADAEPDV